MRLAALLLLGLSGAGGSAPAATAYVSDELVLGVYAEKNQQGQRLTTLHSGARVETLATEGEFTQVQLADGTRGWVKSNFLIQREPAAARVAELEEEISRVHATTPALAEAAARSEVENLRKQLDDKQGELQAALDRTAAPNPALHGGAGTSNPGVEARDGKRLIWWAVAAPTTALLVGFGLGYAALARRLRRKFGGIKVY